MDYENKICYYMCVTRASTVNLLAPFFIGDDSPTCICRHRMEEKKMSAKIDFLYLSEPDMIKAGVKDMGKCVGSHGRHDGHTQKKVTT